MTSYDQTPYGIRSHPQTHPDCLAAVAALVGLDPPNVESCRVLEIGSANGGNLLPMAEGLPKSRFVGIDLSPGQVETAKRDAAETGVGNVEYRCLDLAEADHLGTFDYIVAHGVFSWVARPLQERLLALCARLLAPDGIAYVSYNAMPGWGMRGAVRGMLMYHAGDSPDSPQKVAQARALLDFLAASSPEAGPMTAFLRSEAKMLRDEDEWYVLHEHLEEQNHPVFFHEFIGRARAHDLEYVGEADVREMVPAGFGPEVRQVLERLSTDQVRAEQYLDFLKNRMFRQTLLCRADRQPEFSRMGERVAKLHAASPARETASGFECPGVKVNAREPLAAAALRILGERWPASLHFDELSALTGGKPETLAGILWQFYGMASGHLLHLSPRPFPGTATVSARPVARPLARWQAGKGRQVTDLRHAMAAVDDEERQLLARLDGTATGDAAVLARLARGGLLVA